MIESAQGTLESCSGILHAQLYRAVVLRLQSAVALVCSALVIEFGEGGQAESLVVGEEELPSCGGTVGDIYSGIEAETVIHAGGHIGKQSG